MRSLLVIALIALIGNDLFGQDTTVLANYRSAINRIRTVEYSVERIDTFTDGTIWDHKGSCVIQRDTTNKLHGFLFAALRPDLEEKDIYDGNALFRISLHDKTYEVQNSPQSSLLGRPGGQMVFEDLMRIPNGYSGCLVKSVGEDYEMNFTFPDDTTYNVEQRRKAVLIDGHSFLPKRAKASFLSLNKKHVDIIEISKVRLNDPGLSDSIAAKDYLRTYTLKVPDANIKASLLGLDAPLFELVNFNHGTTRLSDFSGKIVLIDFWETWCNPCIESMPMVQALFDKYRNSGLMVLGIMSDEKNLESAKMLIEKKHITYPNLLGSPKVTDEYDLAGFPKQVLVDKNGKVVFVKYGYGDDLEKFIKDKLLTKK